MTHEQKRPSIRPKKPVWFYEYRDEAVGPVDEQALRGAAREGRLTPSTLVWRKTLDGWQPATAVPQVLAIIEQEARITGTASESPRLEAGPAAAQAQLFLPSASEPAPEAPASSRPSPVPAAVSSTAEPPAAELPSSAGSASVEVLADGSPGARPSDASAGEGRSRPPPKPHVSEVADDAGLGDAISEEEGLERPIREADVLELLERTRSSQPPRGPGSHSLSESGAAPRPHGSSMPASAPSERAPVLERVDTRPAPARPLPLWAKVMGGVALLLLSMGAVLLTGRTRGAGEGPGSEPAGRSAGTQRPDPSAQPTHVDVARPAAADRPASAASASAAAPGQAAGTPAVVVTEGPLSPSIFQKLLDGATPMFDEQCWRRLRATEGEVAEHPSISVELGISAWGQFEKLVAGEAPVGYRGVGRCILGRIRGWKFPRAGARTRVTLRIVPCTR
ncbi:MAG: DUF4339 domain-containing protein [Polyangiaceae bacterium]|nr:DUF4339 domain-containing protein [Polyangiaceae bacterium]